MKGTLNYKGELREVDIPTRWEELKFRHFLKIQECDGDWLKIFSVFTGLTAEELIAATWVNLDDMLVCLSFLYGDMPMALPKTILGYTIPQDIGFETVGQYKYIKEDVQESAGLPVIEQLQRYTLYVATYACAQKHGEFSWEKTEQMAEEFLDAPAPEVLATANFTLLKLTGLSQPIARDSPKPATPQKKQRRDILALWLYLVSTVQLWRWKKKPDSQPTR